MRQVIGTAKGARISRQPTPVAEPGRVVVRTRFSLVSTGTEVATLRSARAAAAPSLGDGPAGAVAAARWYLGKAARNPRRAAERLTEIAAKAAARGVPRRAQATVPAGPIAWSGSGRASVHEAGGVVTITCDATDAGYQAVGTAVELTAGGVRLAVSGEVSGPAVQIGLLTGDGSRWLASVRVPAGPFQDEVVLDHEGGAVIAVVANGGTGGGSVVLKSATLCMAAPGDGRASDLDDQGWGMGYSLAGEVLAVGDGITDLRPGDRVACAGAGYANHADVVSVPRNLVARVPPGLDLDVAATATVGAIALQGVRRAGPQIGERVLVIGLGLLGQLACQLLTASGCTVIGVDLDPDRVARALTLGAAHGASGSDETARLVRDLTGGLGADATVVTAATASDEPMNAALSLTRRKGRVVIVGDVGLSLERAEFYRRELDLLMSTSYGPGRYDADYELRGRDYPPAYVRWTLNRNLQAYLDLAADGRLDVAGLLDRPVDVDAAPAAYEKLIAGGAGAPLAVLLDYGDEVPHPTSAMPVRGARAPRVGVTGYALVGAGAFGQSMLLPQLDRHPSVELRAVVSSDAVRGGNLARQRRAQLLATELDPVLRDDSVGLVVIANRHDRHAREAAAALRSGCHVFVEKPLAMTWDDLEHVAAAAAESPASVLQVGFNRRFSPAARLLAERLAERRSPLMMTYRVNAGHVPPDHWIQGPEGGGRNIGEACHMYDLMRFLAGGPVTAVTAVPIDPGSHPALRNENFTATIGYADGSVGTLIYTALGPRDGLPKERLEVFADGRAYVLDDFVALIRAGDETPLWTSATADKGHAEEVRRLVAAVTDGGPSPIPLEEMVETTGVSLTVEDMILGRGGG